MIDEDASAFKQNLTAIVQRGNVGKEVEDICSGTARCRITCSRNLSACRSIGKKFSVAAAIGCVDKASVEGSPAAVVEDGGKASGQTQIEGAVAVRCLIPCLNDNFRDRRGQQARELAANCEDRDQIANQNERMAADTAWCVGFSGETVLWFSVHIRVLS